MNLVEIVNETLDIMDGKRVLIIRSRASGKTFEQKLQQEIAKEVAKNIKEENG
ncbi:MAG: hypothetical protein KAS32_05985 [Candidatus Peribacteraceae bacterium]|nr:hypothetical protein [Candidatus Peribacteraceae bacterium]